MPLYHALIVTKENKQRWQLLHAPSIHEAEEEYRRRFNVELISISRVAADGEKQPPQTARIRF